MFMLQSNLVICWSCYELYPQIHYSWSHMTFYWFLRHGLLCSLDWPWICHPPASAFWVLAFRVCATIPDHITILLCVCDCIHCIVLCVFSRRWRKNNLKLYCVTPLLLYDFFLFISLFSTSGYPSIFVYPMPFTVTSAYLNHLH
jgi:hypothetical protein